MKSRFKNIGSREGEETPNDPKLSDSGVRRGTCAEGGKAAVEAGAVKHGAVRCSAWLGDVGAVMDDAEYMKSAGSERPRIV